MILYLSLFWVVAVIGFVILMAATRETKYRLERMGRYALAVLVTLGLMAVGKEDPKNGTESATQFFIVAALAFWAWIALVEAFDTEEHWKKQKERKAAERH